MNPTRCRGRLGRRVKFMGDTSVIMFGRPGALLPGVGRRCEFMGLA
jgi:hypothetical protein